MHYEGGFGEISLKRNRSPSPQSPQISERHEVTGVTPKARGEGSRGSTRDGPTDETMSKFRALTRNSIGDALGRSMHLNSYQNQPRRERENISFVPLQAAQPS